MRPCVRMDHKGRGTLALESGYQGLDRQRRTTLGSIIYKNVRALSLGHDLLNQRRGVLSHARLCGDDPIVGRVSFDGFLIGESQRREEPENDMGGAVSVCSSRRCWSESGGMAVQWLYTWETWCV